MPRRSPKPKLPAALRAVRSLSRKEPTPDDYNRYVIDTNAEGNDRGAAILLATNLENALRTAIVSKLGITEEGRKGLFGEENSPCGTFSSKIIFAHAIGLFYSETRNNLDIIRTVRNAFAHATIPIDFGDQSILDACTHLTLPPLLLMSGFASPVPKEVDQAMTGKRRFQQVCEVTMHNLLRVSLPNNSGSNALADPQHGGGLTRTMPPALP